MRPGRAYRQGADLRSHSTSQCPPCDAMLCRNPANPDSNPHVVNLLCRIRCRNNLVAFCPAAARAKACKPGNPYWGRKPWCCLCISADWGCCAGPGNWDGNRWTRFISMPGALQCSLQVPVRFAIFLVANPLCLRCMLWLRCRSSMARIGPLLRHFVSVLPRKPHCGLILSTGSTLLMRMLPPFFRPVCCFLRLKAHTIHEEDAR